jgi:hypothetical protein
MPKKIMQNSILFENIINVENYIKPLGVNNYSFFAGCLQVSQIG